MPVGIAILRMLDALPLFGDAQSSAITGEQP